ncbi:UvrD-helicase domain-containing protein [Halomicroarcula sp. S1AR25-4]|uniref:UvrD-helicase domain-containing protein n=1 Tax=Haloarcula sp. S1AR25-4 TaxID=2950538 RepID=UPI002875B23A|nr:UvrD-helicase domain-containing protein [Halomicroarcula sp. S1AR25-4]MDS0278042.1 UvrD-helicase domain-containing protein [Halomicroarcula sp. S1AR25-4]
MTEKRTGETDSPIRLQNAQADIRDAYFDHESGLFTLSCVPGAGKSTVAYRIAPDDILRRYVAGDPTPEQHIAVVSFNRDEAADIVPEVCKQLRTIVEHDLTPVASEVSGAEVESLVQRVQRAPFVGTIDSLLRGVLQEFVYAVGFDGMPSVGNEALLKRVHADCYERLATDPSHAARLEALDAAYESGEYVDGIADMLERAVTYCRDRRLSTAAFERELERTRASVYDGRPESFEDIVAAVERVVGAGDVGESVRAAVDGTDRDRLVAADQHLYDEWGVRIEDFTALFSAYRAAYRELTREYGVVSHTDVAYLVASYFDETIADADCVGRVDDAHRQRVRKRYRGRLRSVIIDEAQDVSAIQHAALSHLVGPEMRVFACGDVRQSIYRWRHADPTLFQSAARDGEYLGVDWSTHRNETATTTYRCVPDVAAAVDAVAAPMFGDESRGDVGDLETAFPSLDPARDGTDETAVHVASFSSNHRPGSAEWVHPEDGGGEADVLATHLAKGLADGTFTDDGGDPLDITVLFRRGTRMGDYEAAFEAAGLRVRNASEPLFDHPAVEAVLDVCDWLAGPGSPERTRELVTGSGLGLASLADVFETHGWDVDAVLDAADELEASQERTLTGLQQLRDRRDAAEMRPASAYLEDVAERLALRSDSNECLPDTDTRQRIAALDALVETVAEWETDEYYGPQELTDLVAPFRETPSDGPAQPSVSGSTYDVAFRTIHRAKGDEADVVAVADPGFDIWSQGPVHRRFVTQGPVAGLAPPTNTEVPTDIDVPPFVGGLYTPDSGRTRDVGLRWATARWRNTVTGAADSGGLVGPDRLQRVVENELAEAWRLLYVALTRPRDHLVVPLPRSLPGDCPRDRWIETLRDGLGFDGGIDSYTLSTPSGEVAVGVNDVDALATRERDSGSPPDPDVAVTPPRRSCLDPWVPRFCNPSTMYPLTADPDAHVLAHLLGDPLHTAANEVPDDLPLHFDALGPESVGTCLHEVVTRLVTRGVPEADLRAMDAGVRRVFDEVVHDTASGIGEDELAALWTFFGDVVEDLLASSLWERLQRAESVRVEHPVDGLVSVADVEVEVHGKPDFVVDLPSGERYVTDVKIALAEPTAETRRRYDLQVSAYAYLFERENGSSGAVRPTIETFGVTRETVTPSWPPEVVERRVQSLLE